MTSYADYASQDGWAGGVGNPSQMLVKPFDRDKKRKREGGFLARVPCRGQAQSLDLLSEPQVLQPTETSSKHTMLCVSPLSLAHFDPFIQRSQKICDSQFSEVIFGVLLVALYKGWIISYNRSGDGNICHNMWNLYYMSFVRSCPLAERPQNTQRVSLGFLAMSTTLDWLQTEANLLGQKWVIGRNKTRPVSCNCMNRFYS